MVAEKRIALVTGAARGLGLAIARALAKDSRAIVVADVDVSAASSAASSLRDEGIDASHVGVDISVDSSVAAAFDAIRERHGRLDILVNNAGIIGLDEGRRPPLRILREVLCFAVEEVAERAVRIARVHAIEERTRLLNEPRAGREPQGRAGRQGAASQPSQRLKLKGALTGALAFLILTLLSGCGPLSIRRGMYREAKG